MGYLKLAPGAAVPRHRDATEEYIHVLKGAGTMTVDGVEKKIYKGMTIFMPSSAEVSYKNDKQDFEALQVFAGPAPSAKYGSWIAVPVKN